MAGRIERITSREGLLAFSYHGEVESCIPLFSLSDFFIVAHCLDSHDIPIWMRHNKWATWREGRMP